METSNGKRQTFPVEIEDCFVGKEDELKQLVSLVVDDNQHRIISIWGMGGIGKTTIARKVYNHDETKRCFECFAWVCITQQCRIRSVLEDVLKQLNPRKREDVSSLSNTELIEQLCQIQRTKRCIVVLDDFWKTNHWDGLKHAFVVEGIKSKVLLTTRKQNVADMGFAFELGLLNMEDGLKLLQKKAFPQSNIIRDFPNQAKLLQKFGELMVHKCGYLPLVISLLGGVLSRKNSVEWELVNENMNSYLYRGKGIEKENNIHAVLNLSYEDLPYYLKPCFLHMGQFMKDETVNVRHLYRLWIAQGMISHEHQGNEETLMDIAELYLSELVSRCIVQVGVKDVVHETKFTLCKLHDVVREFCLSMGKMEDFSCLVLNYSCEKCKPLADESSRNQTRHLVVHFGEENYIMNRDHVEFTITHEADVSKHVRSLQFFNDLKRGTIMFPCTMVDFRKFKFLKVLVFRNFHFPGGKVPREIGNLIHLRYLFLRDCELDKLPSSFSQFKYLDTLDLRGSWNVRVPNMFKEMLRLKDLLLPPYNREKVGNYKMRLEGLNELETLSGFDRLVHDLKSVTGMKNLRLFGAKVCDNESLLTIISATITDWKKLHSCGIEILDGCQFTLVEEGLMILKKVFACPNLYFLWIGVQLGKLLEDCGIQILSSRLMRLYLFECEIVDDPMEILGKLPFLEELVLLERSFLGEEMKCDALGFSRLKYLMLEGLPNLKQWRVKQGVMPLLSEIAIKNCAHLEMVPDGLRFINTLQKFTIARMPELGKRVLASRDDQSEGEDFDKVRHVPSINVIDDY